MDCGIKLIKYIILLFNFIILLTGLGLIVVGVLAEMMYKEYFSFFSGKVNFASISIIVVGIVIFVVAFFGCCGAMKEHYCMIVTYTILLAVVILVQIVMMVAAFRLKDDIENTLQSKMKSTIPNYNKSNVGIFASWKQLQSTLQCCGVKTYEDWKAHSDMKVKKVPDSCCIIEKEGCGAYTDVNTIYKTGCLSKLKTLSEKNVMMLAVFSGLFAFIQIIGVVIGSCLAVSLKKDYESMK